MQALQPVWSWSLQFALLGQIDGVDCRPHLRKKNCLVLALSFPFGDLCSHPSLGWPSSPHSWIRTAAAPPPLAPACSSLPSGHNPSCTNNSCLTSFPCSEASLRALRCYLKAWALGQTSRLPTLPFPSPFTPIRPQLTCLVSIAGLGNTGEIKKTIAVVHSICSGIHLTSSVCTVCLALVLWLWPKGLSSLYLT